MSIILCAHAYSLTYAQDYMSYEKSLNRRSKLLAINSRKYTYKNAVVLWRFAE